MADKPSMIVDTKKDDDHISSNFALTSRKEVAWMSILSASTRLMKMLLGSLGRRR
jgi:hypothetical protein